MSESPFRVKLLLTPTQKKKKNKKNEENLVGFCAPGRRKRRNPKLSHKGHGSSGLNSAGLKALTAQGHLLTSDLERD